MFNKDEIKNWLAKMNIHNDCVIHDDLSVDLTGLVDLSHCHLSAIPFQLGVVDGILDIHDNCFTSLENVGLPHLISKTFIASNNQIHSFKGAPACPNISIQHNCLTSLRDLPKECHTLFADFNYISSLEHTPGDLSLTFLHLDNNHLFHLKGLENLPKLTVLSVCDNAISVLENIPSCLTELFINNNELTHLKGLGSELTYLGIRRNHIRDFSDLKHLDLKLEALDASDNPLVSLEDLPQASFVDLSHCHLMDSHLHESLYGVRYLMLNDNLLSHPVLPHYLGGIQLMNNPLSSISGLIYLFGDISVSINEVEDLFIFQNLSFQGQMFIRKEHGFLGDESDLLVFNHTEYKQFIAPLLLKQKLENELPHNPLTSLRKI